jgi:hypothetical protein
VGLQIVGNRLTLLGPFDERPKFFLPVLEMLDEIQVVLVTASFSGKSLSLGWVGPNGGVG